MISRREYTNSWPSFASLIAENCSGHAWLWGSGGITKEGGFTVSLFLFVSPFYNLILWDVMSHSHKFLFCCCEYKKNYWKSQRKNGKMWVFIPSQWNSKCTAVKGKIHYCVFNYSYAHIIPNTPPCDYFCIFAKKHKNWTNWQGKENRYRYWNR